MDVNVMMQYLSYLMIAIGVMAFIVSVVTQVIKSWPGLGSLPTSAVVIVLSLALCPAAFLAVFACMVAAFVVALVSMDGWERIREIWERTGYKNSK